MYLQRLGPKLHAKSVSDVKNSKPRRGICVAFALLFVLSIAQMCLSPYDVHASVRSDALIVYPEGAVTTPRYRIWTGAMGAENNAAATAATMRHVIIKASPDQTEMMMGVQTTGGALYIQRWNGTAWAAQWNVTVGNTAIPAFDIEYEQTSGEAVVVYSGNVATTNELRYRVWTGAAWVGPTNLDPIRTTGTVNGVKMAHGKGINDLALVWGDSNADLSANYWNGSTNAWVGEPAAALSTSLARVGLATVAGTRSYDVAFEYSSGDVLVGWGDNATLDMKHVTRGAGSGGAWGTVTTTAAFAEEPTDIELKSDPRSDYIAYVNATDNGTDAEAAMWTGSAWANINNFDTTVDTIADGTKNVAVEWVSSGTQDRAVVTYDDNNAAGVDWLTFNKNTGTWTAQTDFTTAPAPSNVNDLYRAMVRNPWNRQELLHLVTDGGQLLYTKRLVFDGTNFTWSSVEGGAAIGNTVSVNNGTTGALAYYRLPSAPNTLTTDIVDANGTSVGSPSAAMSALTLSFSCQTATGTLGVASQLIRVDNNTGNNLWTLSIAATSGNTSQWTSGGFTYDYNDSGGSPAGCGDSGDADVNAGQLTINPSGATATAVYPDCTTTGITFGSSAAFNQGVTDSVTLITTGSTAMAACVWDFSGIALSQQVIEARSSGAYSLGMTLTIVAN